MIFNWKLESIKRMFGLKKSNKGRTARKLNIENLEERIECATKVWGGSLAGVGTDGTVGPPPAYGTNGDPTFSSFMASIQLNNGFQTLGDNWAVTLGQPTLPQNGDTLVFPLIADTQLLTPTAGVFGNLTRIDTSATPLPGSPPPGPIVVNLINDLSPDSNGNLPGYLRDPNTGANYFAPLVYVDSLQFQGAGYTMYGRDNPQFGPSLNPRISPVNNFPTTITAAFFFPGATNDQTTPFFQPNSFLIGSPVFVDPATVDPLTNVSTNPAVPLNIQTQISANYVGSSLTNPTGTSTGNANWIYSPINVGNPNSPQGSSFVFNVNQEGSWLILDSDRAESTSAGSGGYVLLNDVNDNKIVKQGLGLLVFESKNGYTGSTSVQQGILIVSDSLGLGPTLTNSNVEVSGGSLMLAADGYGSNQGSRVISPITIANRNLILTGGDGYRPLTAAVSIPGVIPQFVPFGQFTGRDSNRSFIASPHQWNGTVTLNSNPAEVTTSTIPSDIYGNTSFGNTLISTVAVGSINVTNGGAGYTAAPTVTIQEPNGAIAGTPTVVNGLVTRIPVLNGGAGYTAAPLVTITGVGTGATAIANLRNGVVTTITITNAGINYTLPPTITIAGHTAATLGAAVFVNGVITAIPVTAGGDGYLTAPTVTILGGGGSGATATANIANGAVISFAITNGGSGYTSAPTVTLSPLPTAATAGAVTLVNNVITAIAVAGGGTGYTTAPLIVISGGGGTGATATATLSATGVPANPNGDPSVGQEFASSTEVNGVISGPAGLRKWGAGTVELTQANTFNGDVVIFDGFLNAQNNTALGIPTDGQKDIIVRELPGSLLAVGQQLAGALTLGDAVNGGKNLVFGSQYNLIIQDGNTATASNNGPDQNPGTPISVGTRVEGLGAFQVVSPSANPNSAEWQGTVTAQTNASIGGTPNSQLLISGTVGAASGITLEKRGSMNVGLSANNSATFSGTWLVSNGNLQIENNNALGNAALVSVTQLSPPLPALSGAGSIQLKGSGLNVANNVTIQGTGYNGFGALQSIGQNTWSGIITASGTASLGAGAGSDLIISGQITQASGAQLIKIGAGNTTIAKAQTSLNMPISVMEGTLLVQAGANLGIGSNFVTVSTSVPTSPATLALDGGVSISNRTLNLDGIGIAGAGALRSISGSNTWGGNINLAGTSQLAYVGVDTGTLTLSGRIDGGSSTLQKTGSGVLIISGNGNTQGSTVVGAGTVYQLGQDNVPVFVNTSGTLQGNGRLGVLNMTAGQNGIVNPGTLSSTVSKLTTSGISAQSSVGVFAFDIASAGVIAGTNYDQLVVNGTVNLSGSPVLNVNLLFSPTSTGTVYTIINNDGTDAVIGTFNGLAEGAFYTATNNIRYQVSYVGGDGNDVTLTSVGVLTTNLLTSDDVDNLTRYGQTISFTSSITSANGNIINSGSVQFFDQGIAIGQPMSVTGGSATLAISTLSVNGSPHVITSTYSGQGILGASTSNIIANTVTKSSSTVAVSSNSQIYGTGLPLTVTATVTPENAGGSASGQVIFRIDGVIQLLQTLSTTFNATTGATTAILSTTINTVGFFQIDAQYLGDSNVNGSVFSPLFTQQILTTAVTTVGLVSSKNPSNRFDQITFTASISNSIVPTEATIGFVQFVDNGVNLGAPVGISNNTAVLSTSSLRGGHHKITANFLGGPNGTIDRYLAPSTATISQGVTATSDLIITGTNIGGGPQVNVYNKQTQQEVSFYAFAPEFRGGVRVASGDVTGDGIPDVIVAAGPGGGPQVNVYDGVNLQLFRSFYAYNSAFSSGIFIAVGDVNGDGYADIITGAGQGGGPHVQVFSGLDNSNIASFFAYSPTFTGGVSVASGDLNADGYSDVVVGAGPGGGPHVLAVSGLQLSQGAQVILASFFAFDPGINQGVFVAAGDYTGDGVGDIVVAAGPGGSPHIKVFNGSGTNLIDTFFAFNVNLTGGLSVSMADINNDGTAEIITAPYTKGGPEVKVFKYLKGNIDYFYAYDPLFTGGVFVG